MARAWQEYSLENSLIGIWDCMSQVFKLRQLLEEAAYRERILTADLEATLVREQILIEREEETGNTIDEILGRLRVTRKLDRTEADGYWHRLKRLLRRVREKMPIPPIPNWAEWILVFLEIKKRWDASTSAEHREEARKETPRMAMTNGELLDWLLHPEEPPTEAELLRACIALGIRPIPSHRRQASAALIEHLADLEPDDEAEWQPRGAKGHKPKPHHEDGGKLHEKAVEAFHGWKPPSWVPDWIKKYW